MSTVFLMPMSRVERGNVIKEKTEELWQRTGFGENIKKHELTAIKLHVGEPGTDTFVSPFIVKGLVSRLAKVKAKTFLTDTAVLYKSPRDNAVSHVMVAENHGFGINKIGAPFIPADGLRGEEQIEVPIEGGKHYEKVGIAAAIMEARNLLILSHATGHLGTGIGAALKNLGMGCASKKAKLSQHFGQQPRVEQIKCTACGICAKWCPAEAINVMNFAEIDQQKCLGCGECIAVCQEGAVEFDWSIMGRELQERIVEHALAVVKDRKENIWYVTAAMAITKDCDCLGKKQKPLVEDIGLLASDDPVAIDKAVLDLVQERAGRTLESMSYPRQDGSIQVNYAEKLGLGSSRYKLVTLG